MPFLLGADGSPTGVDGVVGAPEGMDGAVGAPGGDKASGVLEAPIAAPVRPHSRPVAVRPQVVRPTVNVAVAAPQVVRPKAVRPGAHAEMLQRLAQDFQNHPPPMAPLESEQVPIEIVNVPANTGNKISLDDCNSTADTTSSSISGQRVWNGQVNPSVKDAKKRLRARRTMSDANLGAALHIFQQQEAASKLDADEDLNNKTQPEQPHAPAAPQLVRPTPIRPKPLKRTQSQGMLNQISHEFQNLPTQQLSISRAPSVAPLPPQPIVAPVPQRAPSVAPQPVPPSVQMQMQLNQPPPRRPRIRRQSSSRSVKPSWYHQVARQNRLGSIQEDNQQQKATNHYHAAPWDIIQQAKTELLHELNQAALDPNGDNDTPAFQAALAALIQNYDPSLFDPRAPVLAYHPYQMQLEGIGISAGKPTFPGCIGRNPQGDPLYKLGRMSFDMFRPTELVVSVQGSFCLIDSVDRFNLAELQNVPKNLQNDVRDGINPVRTYNIVTPFTIEAWRPEFGDTSPNKGVEQPIQGVMTTYGFLLPYPTQNRFSVWFTGGSLEVDGHKNEKWFQIFDKKAAPKRTAFESSKLLAAKLLMGACVNDEMDQDGTLKYTLTRPVASYIDLVYLDNSLQVLRGSSGTVYVHVRLPGGSGAVHQSARSDQMLPAPVDPLSNNTMLPSSNSPVNRFLL